MYEQEFSWGIEVFFVTIDGCCKPSEIGGTFLGPHYRDVLGIERDGMDGGVP